MDEMLEIENPSKEFYRILVVDDDDSARDLVASALEAFGYTNVERVSSGPAAIAALVREKFHVVMLDKNMPDMDGIHVLREGKRRQPECEFIMMTAYGSMETAVQCMDLGAFSYITKPFPELETIIHRVESALELVKVRHERDILYERLSKVVNELQDTQAALKTMHRVFNAMKDPHREELEATEKVGDAIERLRRLAVHLERLRVRTKGTAAVIVDRMDEEVSGVARILSDKINK